MRQLVVKNWDLNYQVSNHFKLGEFINSETAYKQKLLLQYIHQPEIVENIEYLANTLLEPVRKELDQLMIITSGYRCRPLNTLCGGANGSMHLQGLAADVYVYNGKLQMVKLFRELPYHQIIVHPGYVHVAIHRSFNRGLYLNETSDKAFNF